MAVRKTRKEPELNIDPAPVSWKEEPVGGSPKKFKWGLVIVLLIAGLGLWWWRTNTWPIVAVVGLRPVTRFEVDQNLFKQYGKTTVENLITQRIIENELNRANISVDEAEIDAQIQEAKSQFPPEQDFDAELAKQGLDMPTVRNLISLQLRLGKVVSDKVTVSTEEIADYINENGQYMSATTEADRQIEAEESLKQQKQNEEISVWVENLRETAKVWRAPGI